MVVTERVEGLRRVRVRELASGEEHEVSFPEPAYSVWVGPNPEFDTTVLRFGYTSLVTPESVYDYDMATRKRDLMKQEEVLGGYDPAQYESERLAATCRRHAHPDLAGLQAGVRQERLAPLLPHGLRLLRAPYDADYSSFRLSLLDRGFCFAIAHIRGGGDLGEPWYEQGRLLAKKNTFIDFIAAAEHLVAQRYTSKGKLAIQGGARAAC